MSFLALYLGLSAALATTSDLSQSTTRVSVDSSGIQGNLDSQFSAISSDGRIIGFQSAASNLVAGDTNGTRDIFIRDTRFGITERVSLSSSGMEANSVSFEVAISNDGRHVAFASYASNLVVGDTNSTADVFVHDRQSGLTRRVSVNSTGGEADGPSSQPAISGDGRFVAFTSLATNLVTGDTNGFIDTFIHDRLTGITERASISSSGSQANGACSGGSPSISIDGHFVAFNSEASNLVTGDTNGYPDVFLRDLQSGTTARMSVVSGGGQANNGSEYSVVSSDGRYVVFTSDAANLVAGDTNGKEDVFLHDRQTGSTERVSLNSSGGQGNNHSWSTPAISHDSRYVAFRSAASNLVNGDTNGFEDIFVRDLWSGITSLVSVDASGRQANDWSLHPSISGNGRFVAFNSWATNLVTGDTNGVPDIYLRDRGPQPPVLLRTGACPGPVTLTVADATPSSLVVLLYGPAGVFTKPSGACAGLTLAISPPSVGAMRTTDAGGGIALTFPAPPGACGLTIQGVDAATCTPTNALVL